MLRVHLVPALVRKRLDAISTEDVQRLKVALNGTAIKTINNILSLLSIDTLPCSIRLLKVPEGSIDFYDVGEYEQLVTAAARVSANAHLIMLLGGDAALRGGEMRALEWSDVNLKRRQLRVERNDWKGQVSSTRRTRGVPPRRQAARRASHGRPAQEGRATRQRAQ